MLNTVPLKKPEIRVEKPTHIEKVENIINNDWSQEERSHLLQKRNDTNIMQSLHNPINNINKPFTTEPMPSDKIMIGFSKSSPKITIYDENKNVRGAITLSFIVKYLANVYDVDRQFMQDIDIEVYRASKCMIKAFIFKIDYNKKSKKSDIIILDYTQSGLMGDIKLLCHLNDLLCEYQDKQMQNDLSNITNNHNKIKIEQNIKKFIYLLLNYTIKLIFVISEKIKDKKDMCEVKNALLKYAIKCSHRINLFVQEQLSVIYICDKEIKKAYVTNMDIKNVIKKRLEDLTKEVVNDYKSDRIVFGADDILRMQ